MILKWWVCSLGIICYGMIICIILFFQCLLSGGVDSTVCAVLLHKALPKNQVIAIHIDNGFMRKDESTKVVEALRQLNLDLTGKYIIY